MTLARLTTLDAVWVALTAFLVLVALALSYLLVRLGRTVGRVGSLVEGVENDALPILRQLQGTVDRVNAQLDKVDQVTDSAVDAAAHVDGAVRAVTAAITRPVEKISGFAAGLLHGGAALRARRDPREAVEAGREAAARREREIEEELERE